MYEKTILPSGIRIVSEYIPDVRSVTLGVWFEVGSRNELGDQQGYSHFLEHIVFKGSAKYSARTIAELIDGVGGYLNAFTSREYTCYYASVLDQDFPLAADILKEMLLNPLFAAEEIERERQVILEEIKASQDLPEDQVHELFYELLWPEHPLGRSILGTESSISQVTQEDLIAYYRQHYTPDQVVIAAAGNIEHQALVDQFAREFDALNQNLRKADICLAKPTPTHSQIYTVAKDLEQVHICCGGSGLNRSDPNLETLRLLDTLVGGGMSSRLFQELRENRGMVYNVYSDYALYRDAGEFLIYAACSPSAYRQVIEVIRQEVELLALEPISEAELKRIKGQAKGSLVLALESTMNRMVKLAKDEFNHRRIVPVDETLALIDQLSSLDLHSLAQTVLDVNRWNLVVLGPV
jgi:predicted Zn-dependent peptidase